MMARFRPIERAAKARVGVRSFGVAISVQQMAMECEDVADGLELLRLRELAGEKGAVD